MDNNKYMFRPKVIFKWYTLPGDDVVVHLNGLLAGSCEYMRVVAGAGHFAYMLVNFPAT